MPRSSLLTAIEEIDKPTTETPPKAKAKATPKAKRKPGPAKLKDQDGRDILKARQTRRADLMTEDERAAALAELYSDLEGDEPASQRPFTAEEQAIAGRLRDAGYHEAEIYAAVTAPRFVPGEVPPEVQAVPPEVTSEEPGEIVRQQHDEYLEVLSAEPFVGKQVVPSDDPFEEPAVVDHVYRLAADHRHYVLQERIGGRWIEQCRGYELANLAMHFAWRSIQCQVFHEAASKLPRLRPGREAELEARSKPVEPEEPEYKEKMRAGRIDIPARVIMSGLPEPRGGPASFNWIND
jgi:hypothetical protein